jgi:excisionase family DNA binding protein
MSTLTPPPDIATRLENQSSALSATRVALILGLGRTTVYDMTAQGDIPYYRLGTKIRYDGVEVAAWWRSLAIPATI